MASESATPAVSEPPAAVATEPSTAAEPTPVPQAANGSASQQKAKITLYWLNQSRSQRILWLLEELDLEYDLKTFKREADMRAPPELKKIHPLGKAPVMTIQAPGREQITIAESAAIVEYLTDHYGPSLIPQRYPAGHEGQAGWETEEWLRYRQILHYSEGTIMPLLVISLVFSQLEGPAVPFLIRPISKGIAKQIRTKFLNPNFESNFKFLESQLATSPQNGKFLAGDKLTGADIMMSFPLEAGLGRAGLSKEKYPKLVEYVDMLHQRDAYKRAVKKAEEASGEPFMHIVAFLEESHRTVSRLLFDIIKAETSTIFEQQAKM